MGQRHQIYVHLPAANYGATNPNTHEAYTIGIHHQWLFGRTALRQLTSFMKFVENQNEYGAFVAKGSANPWGALEAIYSLDLESGYYAGVCVLRDEKTYKPSIECDDPTCADNNNGITVIDLSGDTPKYCFMSIGHLECLDDTQNGNYRNFVPMSADKWITLHYPDYKTRPEKEFVACRSYVRKMNKYRLCSAADIARIFPEMNKVEALAA